MKIVDKSMLLIDAMMRKAAFATKHIKCLQIFGKMSQNNVAIIDQCHATIHIKCVQIAAKYISLNQAAWSKE